MLYNTLDVVNSALIRDIQLHYSNPTANPYPDEELLSKVSDYLENVGINDPLTKIYITTKPIVANFDVLMALFVMSHAAKFQFSQSLGKFVALSVCFVLLSLMCFLCFFFFFSLQAFF
jgi:WASH complex subunit strumpellin